MDPEQAWEQRDRPARPERPYNIVELGLSVERLEFHRRCEAPHLKTMWEALNENVHLLNRTLGKVVELERSFNAVESTMPNVLRRIEENDDLLKQECVAFGAKLDQEHRRINEHIAVAQECHAAADLALAALQRDVKQLQGDFRDVRDAVGACGPVSASGPSGGADANQLAGSLLSSILGTQKLKEECEAKFLSINQLL